MTEVPSVDSNQLKPSSCSVRIIEICPSSVEHAVSDSEKISEFEIIPALFCPKKEKTHKTGSFSFEAQSAFILTDENSLFIGKDTKISKLTVSKE